MKAKEFNTLVEELGWTLYALAPVLGIGLQQAYRYSNGRTPVSRPVATLLRVLVAWKINPAEVYVEEKT